MNVNDETPCVKPSKRKRISSSRISTYTLCGLRYYYREIEGQIKPPGIAARIGTATHKAIEADLTHKMDTGLLLEPDVIKDLARDAFTNVMTAEGAHWTEEELANKDKTLGQATDLSVRCASAYHDQIAPNVYPTEVEKSWAVKLNDDWDLTGHIDVVEADGDEIRDTKTAQSAGKAMKTSHLEQILTYAVGVYVNDKKLPKAGHIDVVPKLKKKDIEVKTFSVTPTIDALRARIDHAVNITKAIDAEIFLPADGDSWVCSEKFCGFYDQCPHGRAKRIQG